VFIVESGRLKKAAAQKTLWYCVVITLPYWLYLCHLAMGEIDMAISTNNKDLQLTLTLGGSSWK